ncbi:hypothetical protein BDD12DRAFT_801546 [Trichophaea hybrida]|nr:hypothetical protein BDD12DRAFT_801546 [Trichophaea hybrida]
MYSILTAVSPPNLCASVAAVQQVGRRRINKLAPRVQAAALVLDEDDEWNEDDEQDEDDERDDDDEQDDNRQDEDALRDEDDEQDEMMRTMRILMRMIKMRMDTYQVICRVRGE